MYGKKTLLAAAALTVLSAAGLGSASAAPWYHGHDRHSGSMMRRHYVDGVRIDNVLRLHRYARIGQPYFVHGHYVVRSHNHFGRTVFVEIDPHSGAFLGEFRL